jgi:hypothetical protein
MTEYTINLTTVEDLALSYVAAEQHAWIDNVVRDRCRIATEEIVKICVDRCLALNIQIPPSKDEIVILAFNQGWVTTAAYKNEEFEANKPIPE